MLLTRFPSSAFLLAGTMMMLAACAIEEPRVIPESSKQAIPVQLGELGTVDFPTTCSAEAQSYFMRGVAALHSFWYSVALDDFRSATRVDQNCMMGYWGEAMAHNHPIWGDPQEIEAARAVIENIRLIPELTSRERAWLNAVTVLYGEGDKAARDKAYVLAMKNIYQDYPNDSEAALFYALALMGAAQSEDFAGIETRLRAGEIAAEVYMQNPNHPGAAHYVIHAYDDTKHARLALDAAQRYAEIAPAAPHALHMPSHIFLQLGMWPEAAASNEASWAASVEWVKLKQLPISEHDYHSLRWLMYVYLQQGRYDKAKELRDIMRESLTRFPQDDLRNLMFGSFVNAAMTATYLVETEQWNLANQILPSNEHDEAKSDPEQVKTYAIVAQIPVIFARGLAAAMEGSPDAQQSIIKLREIREKASGVKEPFVANLVRMTEIQALEIDAMTVAVENDFDAAISIMQKAIALEAAMPSPSGPPPVIKPLHELFGEILLRAGNPKAATEQFAASLRRHPKRARSLLGAARAAAQNGQTIDAANRYAQFAFQWQHSDVQLPELREAQDYTKQSGGR